MKYNYSKAVLAGVLVLALAAGGTAMAENINAEQNSENKVSLATTGDENKDEAGTVPGQTEDQTQKEEEGTATNLSGTEEKTALNEALTALEDARKAERLQKLEEELKEYVDAGSLTQEQADLILEHAKERKTKGIGRNKGDAGSQDQTTAPSMQKRKRQQNRQPHGQQPQGQQNLQPGQPML